MEKIKKINFTKIKIYNNIKKIAIIFFIVPIYAVSALIGIGFETCKIIYYQLKSKLKIWKDNRKQINGHRP